MYVIHNTIHEAKANYRSPLVGRVSVVTAAIIIRSDRGYARLKYSYDRKYGDYARVRVS